MPASAGRKRGNMYQTFSMELAGRTLSVDVNRVGKQANGCAFMHYGETTVLSTATASDKPRDGIDFFPLSVEYEEKLYSVGKIPGGFNKREGKASENAILTSRVIDRPMRPLFPKDYRNDVTLNNMVMSVDPECRPELVAMLGAAIATSISDIPFNGPCATTQVGLIDGELIINPTQEQWKIGDLNLTVASTREKVIMIEAGANEVPEAKMLEAIYKAHEVNQTIIDFIDIQDVDLYEKIDCKSNYLIAGVVDIHCHGGGGSDFMDGDVSSIEKAVVTHLSHGTTTIYPTTMSAEFDEIERTFDIFRLFKKNSAFADVAKGLHLEGPFLSPKMCGAQRLDLIIEPTEKEI